MKKLVTLLLFVAACAAVCPAAVISGLVTNSVENAPEPFATVRLYQPGDTVKPVAMCVSGEDGRFSIRPQGSGSWRLTVQAVGMKTLEREVSAPAADSAVDLGELRLEAENQLGEVTVSAVRPLVKREIDRLTYDVKADEDSKTQPILEILRKVPMVTVDGEGNIKVKGSSSFKIYKNGRPNNAFTTNAKEIFKAIPASSIKRIEVITDPGAREDAEGSSVILNIVTDSDSSLFGIMGSAGLSAQSNNSFLPAPNLWLTAQAGKFTMSLWGGYYYFLPERNRSRYIAEGRYADTGNIYRSSSSGDSRSMFSYGGLEASFELDSLNLFTAELNLNPSWRHSDQRQSVSMLDPSENVIYSFDGVSHTPLYHNTGVDAAFNYQRSTRLRGETLTLSYRIGSSRSRSRSETLYENMVNMPVDYSGLFSSSRTRFTEHTGQFDWSRPYGEHHKLDLGLKYIHRINSSVTAQDYVGDVRELDNFRHTTQVAAAYADYRLSLGRFNARAGLRYEYSRLAAHFVDGSQPDFHSNLNDLVPNASVSWDINDEQNLKLSYGMSISRPGIGSLNPAETRTPVVVSSGNPDLVSARNNSLSLNYSLTGSKLYLEASLDYAFINNAVGPVRTVRDGVIYSTMANGERQRGGSASLYAQWTVSDKTSLMLNANGGYSYLKSPSLGYDLGRWWAYPYVQLTQRLPWNLRASGSLFFYCGYISSLYQYTEPKGADHWYWSLSLQRSFLPKDRLTVRLWVQNLGLMHSHDVTYSVNSDYTGRTTNFYSRRANFGISVSMSFGSLNARVKKVNRSISNDDLGGSGVTGSKSSGGN